MQTFASKKFKSLWLAGLFSMILEYIALLSDNIVAGNMLGEDALAGMMMLSPFFSLCIGFSFLITIGTQILYSLHVGEGRRHVANQYFSQALILGVFMGLILGATAFLGLDFYLSHMDITDVTKRYAFEYGRVMCLFPLVQCIESLLFCIILNEGSERLASAAGFANILINICVSVVLCSFMGIGGIALGTIIAIILEIILLLFHFKSKQNQIRFHFYLKGKAILAMLKYSISDACVFLFLSILQIVINTYLLSHFGQESIVVFTVIMNMIMLMNTVFDGTGQGITGLIAVYRGENNWPGIRKTLKVSFGMATISGVVVALFMLLGAPYLVRMFGITDATISSQAIFAMKFLSLTSVFFSWLMLLSQYYVYMGKITLSLVVNFLYLLICPVTGCIVGGNLSGAAGAWIGLSAGFIAAFFLAMLAAGIQLKKDRFPFLISKEEEKLQFSLDVPLRKEEIMRLVDWAKQTLEANGIDQKTVYRVMLMIEETEIMHLAKNRSKHSVVECTILLNSDVTLILRDAGNAYEITDQAPLDTLDYTYTNKLFVLNQSREYILTNGYNRTIFHF